MDEIVIEDKKYISTKRAAKVTGYAKDYVGQLCREGRVPARLVGRSWYVLESALTDHRFGNESAEPDEPVVQAEKTEEEEHKYPKYQADEIETIEILSGEHAVLQSEVMEKKPERETIKDAWEAWFDRVANATMHSAPKEEEVEEGPAQVQISREETVAIRAVVQEEESQEDAEEEVEEELHADVPEVRIELPREYVGQKRTIHTPKRSPAPAILASAKISMWLIGLFFVVAFVLSTGFFDENIISVGRDMDIAGISVYKK